MENRSKIVRYNLQFFYTHLLHIQLWKSLIISRFVAPRQFFLRVQKIPNNSSSMNTKRDKRLTCRECQRMFLRPSALKVHMRIHSGEKPYKCLFCPRAFNRFGNLTVHLRTHTGERPFKCTVCKKGFSPSNSLQTHMRTHTGERPFKCERCSKRFTDRYAMTAIS
mgnify:CR=1 FL=1